MIGKTAKGIILGLAAAASISTQAATRFDPSDQPLGSLAPFALSKTNLQGSGATAYRPWFENGSWQGDIVQYTVSTTGRLTTTVDLSGTTPTNSGSNWSALVAFRTAVTASSTYWDGGREIITAKNGVQVPFRWGSANLSAYNMAAIDQAAFDEDSGTSTILNWLRGERINEFPDGSFRARNSIMGDVIHANPLYVGAPRSSLTENGYATWADSLKTRLPRVYAGANDGMLHAFDAANGTEVYAYIPSMLLPELKKLVSRPYQHSYFVDGKLTVADAYFSSDTDWHTVLVGTLGAGGKGVFALDITNPDLADAETASGSAVKVLWEKAAAFDPNSPVDDDMGHTYSRPVITKLNDNKWYAVLGNGYNSVNGEAMLYLINLDTGAVTKVGTNSGTTTSPNGLSSPRVLDANRDGKTDYVYAGDINGNLWRFDLTSTTSGSGGVPSQAWAMDYALHIGAVDLASEPTQPIISAPEIIRHPDGGFMVYFATGRLFTADDRGNTTIQAMYGLRDTGSRPAWQPSGTQNLLSHTWEEKPYNSVLITDTELVAVFSPDAGNVGVTQHGWKALYPAGFRVLEGVQVRGGRAKATVTEPVSGANWLSENYTLDGGPNATPIYNLNRDAFINVGDLVDGNANGITALGESTDIPMAWQRADGIMSRATIARVNTGFDTLLHNNLNPPVDAACRGDCVGGFQGGHIDVDTWHDTSATFGGASSQHDHEYDKSTGRVYVDFFDINVSPSADVPDGKDITGQIEINSTGNPDPSSSIGANDPFVVLVANADFSRGSDMRIGNKTRNVVEYQREIHMALKDWDPDDPNDALVDSDGDSLIFTWAGIAASGGGSIRHSFDDVSILSGGLHPTQTGCVKDDAYGGSGDTRTYDPSTNVGRWRNGALVTQLVKASHFTSNPAINQVTVQKPVDLVLNPDLPSGDQIHLWDDVNDNGAYDVGVDEPIGGLIATSGSEQIWESTLFWHFGALYDQITGGGKPCYGDANWEAAAALEQSENPSALLLDDLLITDLDQAILDNESCGTSKDKDGGCQDLYNALLAIKDIEDSYSGGGGDGGGDDGGTEEATDDDSATEIGGEPTDTLGPGPDFDFGRQSWTDVVPD